MEKIEKLIALIDETNYWDARVFEIGAKYFGDQVFIVYEDEGQNAFLLEFDGCFKVEYENNYTMSNQDKVRDMRKGQLGYFMQDISVKEYDKNPLFIECLLNLSIMNMRIICNDIRLKKIPLNEMSFFWERN